LSKVETVKGPVDINKLGIIDYHEHIYTEIPTWLAQLDSDLGLDKPDNSVAELTDWHQAGGKTIIDMTAADFGRNIYVIQKIADRLPEINILVTTGYNRPWYMGRWVYELSEKDMIKQIVKEINKGIQGSGVKAAVIKAGTEYNIWDKAGKKLLRVASKGFQETGRPIITHTTAGTLGVQQVDYLSELGVPANKVCLSHMDRNPDFQLHSKLAETGVYLGYDCFGKIKYGPEEIRLDLIKKMVDAGFGTQILVGNDLARPSYLRHYRGGIGLDYLLRTIIPEMREQGISQNVLNNLLINNPRRFFEG